jgi:hypothetical protein
MISLFAKIAQLYDSELVLDPRLRRQERVLFQPGSLRTHGDVPLLIDHDPQQRVGTLRQLVEFPDTDGRWVAAIADVDDPPAWLKRNTAVSIAYANLSETQANGCQRVLDALLAEVSILSPARKPAEPNARVLSLGIARRETVEETIDLGGIVRRPALGAVLGVR